MPGAGRRNRDRWGSAARHDRGPAASRRGRRLDPLPPAGRRDPGSVSCLRRGSRAEAEGGEVMSTRAIVGSIQHAEVQERLSAIFEAEIEQRREEYKARY